ncbi:hypothetical protein N7523_010180 [Penicillium sp. IBT 18751x]|nr:hypothetical protein N7523_010180 [Penicillium sp. IBT 18751x]
MVAAATSSAPPRSKRSPAALREPRPRKREKYARMACSLCKFQPDTDNFDPQPAYQDLEFTVSRMNRICEQMQQSMGRFGLTHQSGSCLQRKQGNDELPQPSKPLIPTDYRCTLHLTGDAMRARDLQSPPDSKDGHLPVTEEEVKFPDALITLLQAARPVLELGHERTTQLFTIFKDEVYPLYPCISLKLGYDAVNAIFSLLTYSSPGAIQNVDMIDVEITKSVVAIALLVRGDIQSSLASDLESHLLWSVDSCYDQEQTQVEDIIMATLLVSRAARLQTRDNY